MSVNLNILANKAIRGYADVDDISTAVDIYTSGSPYIFYAVNNDANIPVTGLPQQAQYCSQSILQVSPTPDFSYAVTESYINCNSSSLSGSYLYYASFTDSDQPGGFLEDNKGFYYQIFDTSINISNVNTGVGKKYYFRNRKIADFGYQGDWSNVDSVDLMLPNTGSGIYCWNQNNFRYLWEAKGYDNVNNKWWRNYPPTYISGSNPGGDPRPIPFDATASITTVSGSPEIIMWGNGGSPALKTNGATFTIEMDSSMVQVNTILSYCIMQGSLTGSSTPNNGNSLTFSATAQSGSESGSCSVTVNGAISRTITLNPSLGVRNNPVNVSTRWSSISPTAVGFFNVECGGTLGTEQQWQSAGSPPQQSIEFNLSSPFTIVTSNDCILRYIALEPYSSFSGFVGRYFSIYGDYSGSLDTAPPTPPIVTSSLLTGSSVLPIPSSSVLNLYSGFGYPSDQYTSSYGNATGSGWMDMNMSSSKYVQLTGSLVSQSAGLLFDGTTSNLSILSSSLRGIGNSNYTIQMIATLPSGSTKRALFGNPSYLTNTSEDIIFRNDVLPSTTSIDFRALDSSVYCNRYNIPATGSSQLLTFIQSGSVLKVYNGLQQIPSSSIGGGIPLISGSFNLFDNMVSNGRGIYFGYNVDIDTNNYNGNLHNLLIYSRSLTDNELSSSYSYFTSLGI